MLEYFNFFKKKYDYLILVEHKDRELQTAIKIGVFFKKSLNQKVLILSIKYFTFLSLFIKFRIVIFPFAISDNDWPFSLFTNAEKILLSWEQLLSPINFDFKKPKGYNLKERTIHLCWYKEYKNFISNYVNKKNIYNIDDPNLEALMAEGRKKEKPSKKEFLLSYGLEPNKKLLLFPLNFNWAFISSKTIVSRIKRGYNEQDAIEYNKFSKENLSKFIYELNKASNSLSKTYNLVIRTHPGISAEQYINFGKKIGINIDKPNIKFINDKNVFTWIIYSDLVISNWSTCAYHSFKGGKKTYLFQPLESPSFLNTSWWNEVPKINSLNNFDNEKFNQKINSNFNYQKINNLTKKELTKINNSFAKSKFQSIKVNSIKELILLIHSLYKLITNIFKKEKSRDFFKPLIIK